MERFNWKRGSVAAVAGLVMGLAAFIALFGNPFSQRVIFTEDFGQSEKLLNVWTEIEPVPPVTPFIGDLTRITPKKIAIVVLLFFWTLGLVGLYHLARPRQNAALGKRISILASMIWLAFFFFELFAPFNLLGEPFRLVCFELFLEAIIAFSVAWVIVTIYD